MPLNSRTSLKDVTVKHLMRFSDERNSRCPLPQHAIEIKAQLSPPSSSHALIDESGLCGSREMSHLTVWV